MSYALADEPILPPPYEVRVTRETEAGPSTRVLYAGPSRKAARQVFRETRRGFTQGLEPAEPLYLYGQGERLRHYVPPY